MSHCHRYPMPAHTYYVDDTNGLDANCGNSEGAAFQSITKIIGMTFKPGDRILFKRGEEWRGENMEAKSSGTSGRMIYYGGYGTGANPLINPTIRYTDFTLDSGAIWIRDQTFDPHQIFEDNVRLVPAASAVLAPGQWYTDYSHLWIRCTDDGNPNTGHVIEYQASSYDSGFSFNSQGFIDVNGIDVTKAQRGFSFGLTLAGGDSTSVHRVNVTDCSTSWSAFRGFCMGHSIDAGHYDIIMENCTAYDCYGEGFWITGRDVRILNCEVYNGKKDADKLAHTVDAGGILVGIYARNVLVKGCYVHDVYDGALLFCEVELEYGGSPQPVGCVFDGNLLDQNQNNGVHGIIHEQGDTSLFKNNVIVHSVASTGDVITIDKTSTGAMFYHNTVVLNVSGWAFNLSNCTNPVLKNNIVINTASSISAIYLYDTCIGYTFNYNDYYGSALYFRYSDGTTKTGLAAWRTATSQEANSIDTDPDFVTDYSNLHLNTTSPCKNTGATGLGVVGDYDNKIRDASPDIGAYEYIA